MTKKKTSPKNSAAKKTAVKKVSQRKECCSNDPNFLIVLLAGTIIAIAFLVNFF